MWITCSPPLFSSISVSISLSVNVGAELSIVILNGFDMAEAMPFLTTFVVIEWSPSWMADSVGTVYVHWMISSFISSISASVVDSWSFPTLIDAISVEFWNS